MWWWWWFRAWRHQQPSNLGRKNRGACRERKTLVGAHPHKDDERHTRNKKKKKKRCRGDHEHVARQKHVLPPERASSVLSCHLFLSAAHQPVLHLSRQVLLPILRQLFDGEFSALCTREKGDWGGRGTDEKEKKVRREGKGGGKEDHEPSLGRRHGSCSFPGTRP